MCCYCFAMCGRESKQLCLGCNEIFCEKHINNHIHNFCTYAHSYAHHSSKLGHCSTSDSAGGVKIIGNLQCSKCKHLFCSYHMTNHSHYGERHVRKDKVCDTKGCTKKALVEKSRCIIHEVTK